MKKLLLLLLLPALVLLSPSKAGAQAATSGFHRTNQVIAKAYGNVTAQVVPYAKVSVTNTGVGTLALIYSDPLLTQQIKSGTVTADGSGNYNYYFALNQCVTESISSPGQGNITIPNVCSNGGGAGCNNAGYGGGGYGGCGYTAQVNNVDVSDPQFVNFINSPSVTWSNMGGSSVMATVIGGGSAVQVNGTLVPSPVNLVNSPSITVTNPSAGQVQFTVVNPGCVTGGSAGQFYVSNGASGCQSAPADYGLTTSSSFTFTPVTQFNVTAGSSIDLASTTTFTETSTTSTSLTATTTLGLTSTGAMSLTSGAGLTLQDTSTGGILLHETSTGPIALTANAINLTALSDTAVKINSETVCTASNGQCAGSAFQVNGTPLTSSGTINFEAGTNITLTNPSAGNILVTASATAATSFSALTSATNTAAAMLVGSGASLAASGSGTITATAMPASGLTGTALPSAIVTSSLTTLAGGTVGTAAYATLGNTGSDVPQLTSGLLSNTVINWAAPSAIGTGTPAAGTFSALTLSSITGSAQCLHVNSSGLVSGTGSDCGSGGSGSPGGSPNQIQWNSAGVFAGFTMSGDATLVPSTGVITVAKSGGVAFGSAAFQPSSAFQAALGYTPAHSGANTDITSLGGLTTALSVPQGGSGAITLSGYLFGNGTSAFTASATIPGSAILGNIPGNAANLTAAVLLPAGTTVATPSANDNSAKIANTAYVNSPGNISPTGITLSGAGPSTLGLPPTTYSALTTAYPCASNQGRIATVSDSTTQTWGAAYTGSGALFAVVVCDGSAYTIMGK